jgi:hypothetical protein
VLLEFYGYPAEHWIHLRTTNLGPRSRPSGIARSSPAARGHGQRGWRWRSSSSKPPRTAGVR